MKRHEDNRAARIAGTVTLPDGTTSDFQIGTDGGWSQWGAAQDRLSRSVAIMDAMVAGLLDENGLTSDSDDEDDNEGIPADFEVQPLISVESKRATMALMTCGQCGRSWDDGRATGWTPTPSGRCPFEYFHEDES